MGVPGGSEEPLDHAGYTLLLYPFLHRLPDHDPGTPPGAVSDLACAMLEAAEASWAPWLTRLRDVDGGLACAIDDSYFLLPHLRSLMYPDLASAPESTEDYAAWLDQLLSDHGDSLVDTWRGPHRPARPSTADSRRSQRSSVLRLTHRAPGAVTGGLRITCVDDRGSSRPFALDVGWIDLALFPQGVGFLVLRLDHDPQWSHEDLVVLNSGLRQIWSPKPSISLPHMERDDRELSWLDLLAELLQPFAPRRPGSSLATGYLQGDFAQVLGTRFQAVQFTYGDVAGAPRLARLAELVTGHGADHPDWRPGELKMEDLAAHNLFEYWHNWAALCWWGDVAVIAERTRFTEEITSENWSADYLNIILLVGFQRIRLLQFLNELDESDQNIHTARDRSRSVAEQFRRFHHEFWFPRVTEAPLGLALHRQLLAATQVDRLFEDVRAEIQVVDEHWARLTLRQTRTAQREVDRRLRALTWITTIFTVVAPVTGIVFAVTSAGNREAWLADRSALAMGAIGLLVTAVLSFPLVVLVHWWAFRRRQGDADVEEDGWP